MTARSYVLLAYMCKYMKTNEWNEDDIVRGFRHISQYVGKKDARLAQSLETFLSNNRAEAQYGFVLSHIQSKFEAFKSIMQHLNKQKN